jgi:hypothetical protein
MNRDNQFTQAMHAFTVIMGAPIQRGDFLIGMRTLERVLAIAQNAPPLGRSDGSITPELWRELKEFLSICHQACTAYNVVIAKLRTTQPTEQ